MCNSTAVYQHPCGGNDIALSVTNTHTSPISPPPFMVGAAESS